MTLITALTKVYDLGIDFVDLIGQIEENGEDAVTLGFTPDYTEENELYNNQQDNNIEKPKTKTKLSEDDLNQLI